MAWCDRSKDVDDEYGDKEIYIKRWDGDSWEEMGAGSASGGGISATTGDSWRPALILDENGYPVVAWEDNTSTIRLEVYAKRWDGDSWEVVTTGSASDGGIYNGPSGAASNSTGRLIIAWDNNLSNPGSMLVYLKRQNLPDIV